MANTAKFDRQEVLGKATRLFWRKGFHATSTRDIQQATSLRPGSIYAAFGSKSGLFKEVLAFYAQNGAETLRQCIEGEKTILGGLQAFFRYTLLGGNKDAPNELCLLVKSLSELDEGEPELLSETRSLLVAVENRFRNYLEAAVSAGELPATTDTSALARQLQVKLIGLRSYLRASSDRKAVERMIDNLFEMPLVQSH
ncbi:TetR/AcrR family transcriptional regulator [Microbulbifer sp. 2201CG32-9]|uniref:TetR/AcrR family transcriptional regulator n=1 Tax=Microbulbifer sp. 2201CG32-9 TaxID=3232309 RepID=UPI00345B5B8E